MKRKIYRLLSISNDFSAIAKGKYPQRLIRKVGYKKGGGFLNKLFK